MIWPQIALKQLVDFDPTPPRKQLLEANPVVAFMPMASVVSENSVAKTELERPASEVLTGYTYFQTEDVLVAKITPCFENGKIAIADISHECGFGTTEFHVIRVKPNLLDPKYLTHFLRQSWLIMEGERRMTGSAGQRRVPRHFLEGLEIPLPPIKEQQRIAAILDQAEALRAKRRQALAKLDTLTQSLFLEMFGEPFSNSGQWPVQPLGEVSEFENGDRSSKYPSGDDLVEQGVIFLNGKNIVDDQLNLTSCVYIRESKFASLSRGKAYEADLIITLRGTLGSCCIFRETRGPAFVNAQMMIIRAANTLLPEFLHAVLTSRAYKQKFERMSTGVAVPQLTSAQLRYLSVIVPSVPMQKEFLTKSEAIKSARRTVALQHRKLELLIQSLQDRAFRGEL